MLDKMYLKLLTQRLFFEVLGATEEHRDGNLKLHVRMEKLNAEVKIFIKQLVNTHITVDGRIEYSLSPFHPILLPPEPFKYSYLMIISLVYCTGTDYYE